MTTILTQDMQQKLYWYKGTCVKVVDGDTLDIMIDVGFSITIKQRVRLHGINTPEITGAKAVTERAEGLRSLARLSDLLLRSGETPAPLWVQTIKDTHDKYGRLLAKVWISVGNPLELVCVNEVLVAEGLAVSASY